MQSKVRKTTTRSIHLRCYALLADDKDGFNMMAELDPAGRWCWIGLMALTADSLIQPILAANPGRGYTDQQLSFLLRVDLEVWQKAKAVLVARKKIEVDEANIIKVNDWLRYCSPYFRCKQYRKDIKS